MKNQTIEEMRIEAKEIYGEDSNKWMFQCPSCKTSQCKQDFIDLGMSEDELQKYIAFSCIGRVTKDKGCDWTLGGLFQMHTKTITTPDGENHPIFEFDNITNK